MRASVLIPSYQSAGTIRACLASVCSQDLGEPYEVVLSDSGSDGTADIAAREFPSVRVLHSLTQLSAEEARNRAASEAQGRVLAFIDSDCVATRDWLRRMCEAVEDTPYHGVGGAIRPVDGENDTCWAGYFCEFREFLPAGTAREATYLTPGNTAYRREMFQAAGGFPIGFYPLEDQVFYQRLRAAGARICFDPGIVVQHHHRHRVRAFLTHQARIGAANARLVLHLGLQGAAIAARPWRATVLLPLLAVYRFARTAAACWRQEQFVMVRRPAIAALCWLGMWGWGYGFVQGSAREARLRSEGS